MTKMQKFYKISFISVLGVLILSGIFSIVSSIIYLGGNATDFTDITSLVYAFFHLIIVIFAFFIAFSGYKKGFAIFETLSHKADYKDEVSPIARVVAIVIITLGLGLFITFLISIIMSQNFLPGLSFILKMDLVQVGITLFSIGIYFIFYPYLHFKEDIKDIIKE